MNLKHAQYIMTILQEGSITAAAKKLFISQPSLSQVVKLAETNLGAPVFNRSTDPISLTPAGEKYVEAAKQILAIQHDDGARAVSRKALHGRFLAVGYQRQCSAAVHRHEQRLIKKGSILGVIIGGEAAW